MFRCDGVVGLRKTGRSWHGKKWGGVPEQAKQLVLYARDVKTPLASGYPERSDDCLELKLLIESSATPDRESKQEKISPVRTVCSPA